jgi:hypothetical protein
MVMGMLFNTKNTLKILEKLNSRYGSVNFDGAQQTDPAQLALGGSLHDKSNRVGIDLPTDSRGNKPWKKYLDYLDATPDPNSSMGATIGQTIIAGVNTFLGDPKCQAIEFFAVENTQPSVTVSPQPSGSSPYFGSILVQSMSVKSTAAWLRVTMGRPAKGKRRAAVSPGVRTPGERRR